MTSVVPSKQTAAAKMSPVDPALGEVPSKRWLSFVPVAAATVVLAFYAIGSVLSKCGHPAVPLDDAFIHFQYAKRLAGGHFFSYVEGDGYTSGATSFLWPMVLAPMYLVGLRDLAIIWGAWALAFVALGALSVETYRLSVPLAGRGASVGAAAMVLCFGGYLFGASSGMEVVPLAYVLSSALRRSVEWGEAPETKRTPKRLRPLLALSFVAPLLRPEGMLVTVMVAAMLVFFPARAGPSARPGLGRALARQAGFAGLALVGALVIPAVNLAFTGHVASSTAAVKWLPGNPYYGYGSALISAVQSNARLFFDVILDGREWSAVYIPSGARPYALAGLLSIPLSGVLRGRSLRAGLVLAMALAILVPCTYLTFLWNRLRYLWPFAFAWFIGLACLSRCIADLAASIRPRFRVVGAVLSGLFAGALASHLGWTLDDLATSASAIDRQQVALGRWAAVSLEPDARIGVNDTGAITYFSDRKTFDVVGLTTPEEARYWVAGPGSRFEHYEKLFRLAPQRLPTHFIVYRHWLACDAVLGDELHEETVLDQSILGGATMEAFTARYDLLDSGGRPSPAPRLDPLDELDVSDLESEAAHVYDLGTTRETENQALSYEQDGVTIADGARVRRARDTFLLHGKRRSPHWVAARLTAAVGATLEARVDAVPVATLQVLPGGWTDVKFDIPADLAGESMQISLVAEDGAEFGSAHYWLYEGRDGAAGSEDTRDGR